MTYGIMATPSRLVIMPRDVTSIEVKKSTWKQLNQLKEPGDSFDDVIQQLLSRPPVDPSPSGAEDTDQGEMYGDDPVFPCPDCGKQFESFEELKEHMDATEFPH